MITPRQCRAARALLNWTLADLASASGLSRTSLNNFEQSNHNPKSKTVQTIMHCLDQAGIRLISNNGVQHIEPQSESAYCWNNNPYEILLTDICQTQFKPGDEILAFGMNAKILRGFIGQPKLLHKYFNHIQANKVTERRVYINGDRSFIFPPNLTQYRWVNSNFSTMVTMIIYADKHAIFLNNGASIVCIKNEIIASAQRAHFELLWKNAQPIPFTADEMSVLHTNALNEYNLQDKISSHTIIC